MPVAHDETLVSAADFGGKLRQARERRGVSLQQIAAATKISVSALEALERNNVARLPGGIFTRAFVRSYATEVGLNPEDTVREFQERFQGAPTSSETAPLRVLPDAESTFENQQRIAGVLLKIVLISAALAGAILYLTSRTPPQPFTMAARPATAATATTSPSAATVPVGMTGVSGAVAPTTESGTVAGPALGTGALLLELHPRGPCWIALTVDGKRVVQRLMQAGDRETHRVASAAVLDIGDAGAFDFSIDGRPGRSLGGPGQVRTARISRETMAQFLR